VTSILTAVSLLMHMLLGCCWHHEHVSVERPAETAAVATFEGHATFHEEAEPECCEASGEHSHPGDSCQGPQCLTVLRDSVRVPCPDQVVAPAFVPEVAPQLDAAIQLAVEVSADSRIALPLRPHLLYQLLLI